MRRKRKVGEKFILEEIAYAQDYTFQEVPQERHLYCDRNNSINICSHPTLNTYQHMLIHIPDHLPPEVEKNGHSNQDFDAHSTQVCHVEWTSSHQCMRESSRPQHPVERVSCDALRGELTFRD